MHRDYINSMAHPHQLPGKLERHHTTAAAYGRKLMI
jgi:hypothetical protein